MKNLFLCAFAVTHAAVSSAQTLSKIAPLPAGANWGTVAFVSPTKGFICGTGKNFFKTLDGGITWTPIALPGYAGEPLYNVTFIDENIGLVCGNSAVGSIDVYRTTDGGNTWTRAGFPLGGSWYHQDYVSSTVGFMGCNGALVRTTNAGATWPIRSQYPDCPVIYGMDFIDANNGFVAGDDVQNNQYGVFRTVDGGVTWQRVFDNVSNDVIYLTPTVLIAESGTSMYRSTDNGTTWIQIASGIHTGIGDLEKVDDHTIVGVSTGGDIWRSADGGVTWSQQYVGEGDLPGSWSVEFRTPLDGYVAGVSNLIYETHDGGVTWTRMHRGLASGEWNGIAAFTETSVSLVGHHGYAQTTQNAGLSWDIQLIDPPTFGRDTSYSAVSTVGKLGVAVGHWGGLARTLDAGKTWTDLSGRLPVDYYANDVKMVDNLNGWVVGWDYTPGNLHYTRRTHDGGLTWQPADQVNIPGIAIDIVGSNVWIQTGGRPNWRSTNGGQSFQMVELPYNDGSNISAMDMSFANASLGYVCGFYGYLAKTTNGGASWIQVGHMIDNVTFIGVTAVGNELWVCGARQGGGSAFVKRSMDQGATWQTWSLPGQYTTPYKMVRTATSLYLTGYGGETWRMTGLPKIPRLAMSTGR